MKKVHSTFPSSSVGLSFPSRSAKYSSTAPERMHLRSLRGSAEVLIALPGLDAVLEPELLEEPEYSQGAGVVQMVDLDAHSETVPSFGWARVASTPRGLGPDATTRSGCRC